MKINLSKEEKDWVKNPSVSIFGAKKVLAEILKLSICVRNHVREFGEYGNCCLHPYEVKDVCEFIDKRDGIRVITSITDLGISADCLVKLLQNHDCCHTVS